MKRILIFISFSFLFLTGYSQKDTLIHRSIFDVLYSQKLQQPLWLKYKSVNRPTNVNRGTMDFYTESGIITSDGNDYSHNRYDKGHLAPAATFSDNMNNLKTTFSYLNCALQWDELNRGQWKHLEETERIWDNSEELDIRIDCIFSDAAVKLETGATVPDSFKKHIYFTKQKIWKCYQFPNHKLPGDWGLYQIKCAEHKN